MLVLGLDTCLDACSAALLDGEHVLAAESIPMARGHQERLAPLAQALMAEAGVRFPDLQRVGATVGPGSFTGLRVGIAFAKGLASALGIPAVGVGTLETLAAGEPGLVAAVLDARRDQVYLQIFDEGRPLTAPEALPLDAARARIADHAAGRSPLVIGSGAALVAAQDGVSRAPAGCDPAWVARLAAARPPEPIRPLYLRAPDAKLPA